MKQAPEYADKTKTTDRMPQFGMAELFVWTTVIGIAIGAWPLFSLASRSLLAVYLMSFLRTSGAMRRAVVLVLLAMYLPYLWLVIDVSAYPWNGYRWQWIYIGLQLPGLWAEIPFHPLSDMWFAIVTTLATLVGFCVLATLASSSARAAVVVTVITLVISAIQSLVSLAIYRV